MCAARLAPDCQTAPSSRLQSPGVFRYQFLIENGLRDRDGVWNGENGCAVCVFQGREGCRTLKGGATKQTPIMGALNANSRRLPFTSAILYLLWVHEQDKVRVKKKNLPFLGLLARRCFESLDSRPLRSYPRLSLRPVCGKKRERRRKCVLSDHVGLIEKMAAIQAGPRQSCPMLDVWRCSN